MYQVVEHWSSSATPSQSKGSPAVSMAFYFTVTKFVLSLVSLAPSLADYWLDQRASIINDIWGPAGLPTLSVPSRYVK